MKLLLDTHIFIWYVSADSKLPPQFLPYLRDPDNVLYLSVVSLWESIIKFKIGKLDLEDSPERFIPDARLDYGIQNLDLDEANVSAIASLPSIHRDPFDRAIIGQALANNLTLVTVDEAIKQYPVQLLS